MRPVCVFAVVIAWVPALSAHGGDVISIENAGFEDPVLGDDEYVDFALGWELYNPGDLTTAGVHGCWNPPIDAYPGGPPEGVNIGWVYWLFQEETTVLGMSQTVDAVLQADMTYTLSLFVGNPAPYGILPELEGFPGYRIELLAGDTVLTFQQNAVAPPDGEAAPTSISYTASAGDPALGEALTIRLVNLLDEPGAEVDFDDVSLVAEPSLACPADLDGDGVVGSADLAELLGNWGSCPGCDADLNGDDVVDSADLALLLGNWGPCQ